MSDKYARVSQMIRDDGDLSPNDKEALSHVLGLVNVLADVVAEYQGSTVPDVLAEFNALIERGEE